ncbi:MAG: hypothetical protein ACE5HS_20800 [bacterium]
MSAQNEEKLSTQDEKGFSAQDGECCGVAEPGTRPWKNRDSNLPYQITTDLFTLPYKNGQAVLYAPLLGFACVVN